MVRIRCGLTLLSPFLVGVGLLGFPLPAIAQPRTPPVVVPPTDVEVERVTGTRMGMSVGGVLSTGELYKDLEPGPSLTLSAGAEFDNRVVGEVVIGRGWAPDPLFDEPARIIEGGFAARRMWGTDEQSLEAGALALYSRLDRGVFVKPASGFSGGFTLQGRRRVGSSVSVLATITSIWSFANAPQFSNDAQNPDLSAVGRRIGVHLGVGYRR